MPPGPGRPMSAASLHTFIPKTLLRHPAQWSTCPTAKATSLCRLTMRRSCATIQKQARRSKFFSISPKRARPSYPTSKASHLATTPAGCSFTATASRSTAARSQPNTTLMKCVRASCDRFRPNTSSSVRQSSRPTAEWSPSSPTITISTSVNSTITPRLPLPTTVASARSSTASATGPTKRNFPQHVRWLSRLTIQLCAS